MANLGEFLGSLMAEMAAARLRADTYSVQLADLYAAHDLLKHYPVPRFRLPEVRLDIPIIIKGDDAKGGGGRLKPHEAKKVVDAELDVWAGDNGLAIPAVIRKPLNAQIQKVLERALRADPQPSVRTLVTEMMGPLGRALERDPRLAAAFAESHAALERGMVQGLNLAVTAGLPIQVVATTTAIKEVREPDRLARLHLLLSEDAMEWTVIQTADGERLKLVPE